MRFCLHRSDGRKSVCSLEHEHRMEDAIFAVACSGSSYSGRLTSSTHVQSKQRFSFNSVRVSSEHRVCRLTAEMLDPGIDYRVNKTGHGPPFGPEPRTLRLVCENRPPQAEVNQRGRDGKSETTDRRACRDLNRVSVLTPSL